MVSFQILITQGLLDQEKLQEMHSTFYRIIWQKFVASVEFEFILTPILDKALLDSFDKIGQLLTELMLILGFEIHVNVYIISYKEHSFK